MDRIVKKTCENCGKIFDFRETDYKAKRSLCSDCLTKAIKEKYPGMPEEMLNIIEQQHKDFIKGEKKVKNQGDSWNQDTKKLAKWQVEFIEQNKEKLTLGTKKGVRGVQIIFLRNRHEIIADAKRENQNIYFEDSIKEESATPCIFSPIESLRKENFQLEAYKAIENYDPDIEIAVMFFISPGSEQLYVIKRTDVN